MDGMGTSNRSKAFHDVCWKDLKDSGFPDRIAWMKSAAKRYPYMDLSRVGIWGNSAGGQSSAGALLHYPDFYKVAVSSSGCHDNRMDKMWWNEQWMGYPIGPHYAESSNTTDAAKLQGKLLLILGELDDNVDPSSTYQFINALIRANKNFDFLMVPGMGHSLGGDYGEHKRRDFFVKHLLNVNPPDWTWTSSITVPKP
jgi:dipeptidyl aminopeptidase/acylaminoacyl peptidase